MQAFLACDKDENLAANLCSTAESSGRCLRRPSRVVRVHIGPQNLQDEGGLSYPLFRRHKNNKTRAPRSRIDSFTCRTKWTLAACPIWTRATAMSPQPGLPAARAVDSHSMLPSMTMATPPTTPLVGIC